VTVHPAPMADAEAMTMDQLLAEVLYWRENAACWLSASLHSAEALHEAKGEELFKHRRIHFFRNAPNRQVREFHSVLHDALHGDLYQHCESCGEHLIPGQPTVSFEDVGAVHATCVGATPQDIAAGRVSVPVEMIALEDGEAPPADPHLSITPEERLYTIAEIANLCTHAAGFLAKVEG